MKLNISDGKMFSLVWL